MPSSNPTKVVTGEVRLSFVHVFEAYTNNPENDPKYSVTILIPKSDKKTLAKIKAAQEVAKENGKSRVFEGRIPSNLRNTLHDGDEEADLEKYPENAGHFYMNVSNKKRPGVVDEDLNPIVDPGKVYSGCYGRVAMSSFPYNYGGTKGISFSLDNVQFLRDGEPLGAVRSSAEDDFSDDDLL